jgi:hypothetical protein
LNLLTWLDSPWTDDRIEAWNVWVTYYFPMLCKLGGEGLLETLAENRVEAGGREQETGRPELRSVMEQILQCLDMVFFGGQVAPYCSFKWADLTKRGPPGRFTRGKSKPKGRAQVDIAIDLRRIPDVKQLMETTLHELCHAYLALHGCRSERTCAVCALPETKISHGCHFLRISKEVQELASVLHSDMEILLNRSYCLALDYSLLSTIPTLAYIRTHFTRPAEHAEILATRLRSLQACRLTVSLEDLSAIPRLYQPKARPKHGLLRCNVNHLVAARSRIVSLSVDKSKDTDCDWSFLPKDPAPQLRNEDWANSYVAIARLWPAPAESNH